MQQPPRKSQVSDFPNSTWTHRKIQVKYKSAPACRCCAPSRVWGEGHSRWRRQQHGPASVRYRTDLWCHLEGLMHKRQKDKIYNHNDCTKHFNALRQLKCGYCKQYQQEVFPNILYISLFNFCMKQYETFDFCVSLLSCSCTYLAQWHHRPGISPSCGWCQAEVSKSAQSWAEKQSQSYASCLKL